MKTNSLLIIALGLMLLSCHVNSKKEKEMKTFEKGTFGYDLNYLSQKDSVIVLSGNNGQAQIIVSAKYQAKVFTSTANGLDGNSLGFVNYKALEKTTVDEHMNGYGGENRLWLGPEGGKYSVFFEKGKKQVFENWHTHKSIDIEPWIIVNADKKQAILKKEMVVTNYQGKTLKLNIDRKIQLIESSDVYKQLGIENKSDVNIVAYFTDNKITNLNDFEWTKETGTICIWMLDMFNPSPDAVTIIPFEEGNETKLGKVATSDYFGEIPDSRLKIIKNILFLKTDGQFRSKLGLTALRAKSIAGNYDPMSKRLTVITFDMNKDDIYLNQEWNVNKNPLKGDALNAYNDGPLEDGSIMGPFLELESVSPAAFLKPNESLSHRHTVYHFVGDENELKQITEKLFGISPQEIKTIFN